MENMFYIFCGERFISHVNMYLNMPWKLEVGGETVSLPDQAVSWVCTL